MISLFFKSARWIVGRTYVCLTAHFQQWTQFSKNHSPASVRDIWNRPSLRCNPCLFEQDTPVLSAKSLQHLGNASYSFYHAQGRPGGQEGQLEAPEHAVPQALLSLPSHQLSADSSFSSSAQSNMTTSCWCDCYRQHPSLCWEQPQHLTTPALLMCFSQGVSSCKHTLDTAPE